MTLRSALTGVGFGLVGGVLFLFACWACGGSSPAELEPEPCTLVLVSNQTGDTTRIANYAGPPVENLFHVKQFWWEGDCETTP